MAANFILSLFLIAFLSRPFDVVGFTTSHTQGFSRSSLNAQNPVTTSRAKSSIPNAATTLLNSDLVTDSDLVTTIISSRDYSSFLGDDDGLRVIRFHASFCRACKAVGTKYRRHARQMLSETSGSGGDSRPAGVRFADIEVSKNPELCQSLGVKVLPYVQIYRNRRVVEEFTCRPSEFDMLVKALDRHLADYSVEEDRNDLGRRLDEGNALGNELLRIYLSSRNETAVATVGSK